MLKSLFASKTRVELLKLFLLNPEAVFYQRQTAHRVSIPIRAVQRELANLSKNGIITSNKSGNRTYYSLNKDCPIKEELKKIFLKAAGIAESLKAELKKANNIDAAFIYGSFAKDTESLDSDIDLFVVGDISSRKLSSILAREKNALGREINFIVYSKENFLRKVSEKNHFILSLLKEKKILLLGDINELRKARRRKKD